MQPDKNIIWESLLRLRNELKLLKAPFEYAIICFNENKIEISINQLNSTLKTFPSIVIADEAPGNLNGLHSRFQSRSLMQVNLVKAGGFHEDHLQFIKTYLPYALLPVTTRSYKRAVTISHFAQTLDGKIATRTGSSQWIGNHENLIHAHRMRALCDAILIGSNTLIRDNPSLTVRKVAGENPVKIVVGNNNDLQFDKLLKNQAEVIHVTANGCKSSSENVHTMDVGCENGMIDCQEMLKQFKQRDIHSVYVEGGSTTVSNFLKHELLDIVQLHIAPLIAGSGIANFCLPEINDIDQSIAFNTFNFQSMGDHIMFTGEISRS